MTTIRITLVKAVPWLSKTCTPLSLRFFPPNKPGDALRTVRPRQIRKPSSRHNTRSHAPASFERLPSSHLCLRPGVRFLLSVCQTPARRGHSVYFLAGPETFHWADRCRAWQFRWPFAAPCYEWHEQCRHQVLRGCRVWRNQLVVRVRSVDAELIFFRFAREPSFSSGNCGWSMMKQSSRLGKAAIQRSGAADYRKDVSTADLRSSSSPRSDLYLCREPRDCPHFCPWTVLSGAFAKSLQ